MRWASWRPPSIDREVFQDPRATHKLTAAMLVSNQHELALDVCEGERGTPAFATVGDKECRANSGFLRLDAPCRSSQHPNPHPEKFVIAHRPSHLKPR